jgi:hypothetical protein
MGGESASLFHQLAYLRIRNLESIYIQSKKERLSITRLMDADQKSFSLIEETDTANGRVTYESTELDRLAIYTMLACVKTN